MPNNLVFNNVASQLHTQIYGTDGVCIRAVKTDSSGRLEVVGTFTAVTVQTITATAVVLNNVAGTGNALTVDTSALSIYSYYVRNTGNASFTVRLQIAPVNMEPYFTNDKSGDHPISTGLSGKAVLVASHYLQYTRIQYEAAFAPISAEIWFNGKG